ncbi:MAG: FAD-binding oxidoreductase [Thermoanaerobaculia bacterium]
MPRTTQDPQLSGWGRLPVPGREICSTDLAAVARTRPLTRGLGRSYGDASLPPSYALEVAGSQLADRVLAFDPATGILRAEAGLTLREILRLYLPRGFWPPASPGTAFVTLGGMVAADVHGKGHIRDGTFGRHVRSLRLLVADGRVIDCDREREPGLFRATLGGMGLTGHILEVEVKLQRIPSPWIVEERRRYDDLDSLLAALRSAANDWPYTVAWIDSLATGRSLGRGIVMLGRWAEPDEAPAARPRERRRWRVPIDLPAWCLSPFTMGLFNSWLFATAPRTPRRRVLSPESFFYPLDTLEDWNRMYGARGFTQYQCVVPEADRPGATRRFLEQLVALGGASFFSVLKEFGDEGEGLLSFPRPGVTIAIDLPIRPGTTDLVARLNHVVAAEGGRIYLAKDALSSAADFAGLEPRLPAFLAERARWDPEGRLGSALAERLFSPAAGVLAAT